jgi:hypothetical protein
MKFARFISSFSVWLIGLLSISASAQALLTGSVRTPDHQGVPFANLLLLQAKDSALVKGMVTSESGDYRLENLREGHYLLLATMVGYGKTYSSPFTVAADGKAYQVSPLVLLPETQRLKGVTVVARRPLYEQQPDRMIVNVANSIIASGSTALEVLEKAPGVTVDRQHDGIALQGKEGVIIMLDGKQTYLSMADVVALLRSMPSDNIDQIELITNPSARYDAAGNAGIINIRTRKKDNVGTNGSLSLAAGSGRYDRERGSVQLNHRGRKLNLFSSYSFSRGGNYWTLSNRQNQLVGEERTFIEQDVNLHFLDGGQNGKAGLDYSVGKHTTLGLVWTGFWSSHREDGPAASSFRREENGPVYLSAQSDKTLSSVFSNQVANLNFGHAFGKQGGQLSADVDLGWFRRQFSNSLLTQTTQAGEPVPVPEGLLNQMPTAITVRTFKTDYSRPLPAGWRVEAGYKYSSVHTDNNLSLSRGPVGEVQPDPLLSNHFRYREEVNAAYATLSGKLHDKTQLLVGVRAEHTHSLANSITSDNRVKRNYLNLFPSMFLSRSLSKNQSLSFSYSRRIDRPSYESLNPGRTYNDPYLYSQGNAYLQPQYTQSLELKHGYGGKIFTTLGASYTSDLIFFVFQPVNGLTTERTPLNIGNAQVYNLSLSFPIQVLEGFTLQTTLLGFYSQFGYTYRGMPMHVRQLSGRLNGTGSVVLGRGWTAELTGWLNTPRVNALVRSPWLGALDAGLQKALGARLKAKLSVQDIFHTNRFIGEIRTPGFNRTFRLRFDTRIAMLNLSYTFGNQQLKGTRQRKTGSEEEMQRTN